MGMPVRGSAHAAGFDLAAAEGTMIPARGHGLVKAGVSIAIPWGTCAHVAARSGLAVKRQIDVGAGVVDYDYRGEVGVVLFNHGDEAFRVMPGDSVAQLVLDKTVRGADGFGSAGVSASCAGAYWQWH